MTAIRKPYFIWIIAIQCIFISPVSATPEPTSIEQKSSWRAAGEPRHEIVQIIPSSDGNSAYFSKVNGHQNISYDEHDKTYEVVHWDIRAGKQIRQFETGVLASQGQRIRHIAASNDGKYVAAGLAQFDQFAGRYLEDKTLVIWDVNEGKILHQLPGENVYKVDFDPRSEKLLSIGEKGVTKIWSAKSGKLLKTLYLRSYSRLFYQNTLGGPRFGCQGNCVVWHSPKYSPFTKYAVDLDGNKVEDNETGNNELKIHALGKRMFTRHCRNTQSVQPVGSYYAYSCGESVKLVNEAGSEVYAKFNIPEPLPSLFYHAQTSSIVAGFVDGSIKQYDVEPLSANFDATIREQLSPAELPTNAEDIQNRINSFANKVWKDEHKALIGQAQDIHTQRIGETAIQSGDIEQMTTFVNNHDKSTSISKKVVDSIAEALIIKQDKKRYRWFLQQFPTAVVASNKLTTELYQDAFAKNSIAALVSIQTEFPEHEFSNESISRILKLVVREDNVFGYNWFIRQYPFSQQSITAVEKLHSRAFDLAAAENSLEAWNDYVITYPSSSKVPSAQQQALELESEKYSSWFTSDDKNSRALLVKSKQLERRMAELATQQEKTGYMLVIDRMNELLQDQFPAEEATLRHLESEEFKDFHREFKEANAQLRKAIEAVASATNDLARNMKSLQDTLASQSKMLDKHMIEAAQSKSQQDIYVKQHLHWERYWKSK